MAEMTRRNSDIADPRLSMLRELLAANADPQHAIFHQGYHKSQMQFHGLRSPALKTVLREVFPGRQKIEKGAALPVIAELWQSGCWEESMLAIAILERIEAQLGLSDIPLLHSMTRDCEGWAQLDGLACGVLSRIALRLGANASQRPQFYDAVADWINDGYMWTRRASILVHILPARRAELAQDYCWNTWEAGLPEKEFFIRKASGWALREAGKHYPQEVHDFLMRVGNRASGLTRREGARNLPEELRLDILGK